MSERKSSLLIGDILRCIKHIQIYSRGITFDEFSSNFMIVEACLYNMQVMGEAVSKLPGDIKKEEPGIPWILIKNMRNRLIHEYIGTDLYLVWNVIKKELPTFETDLNRIYTCLSEKGQ